MKFAAILVFFLIALEILTDNSDTFLPIAFLVAYVFFGGAWVKQKNRPRPVPQDFPLPRKNGQPTQKSSEENDEDFAIPTIADAPTSNDSDDNFTADECEDFADAFYDEDEQTGLEPNCADAEDAREEKPTAKPSADTAAKKITTFVPTPNAAQAAVVYAEILGRPKALRKR